MTTVTETLYSYVPRLTRRRFARNPSPVDTPEIDVYPGAVLFADIHGFTNLAGRYAKEGAAGIEQLTTLLNAYFDQLIGLIDDHGGDVVKLAGDALVALWPASSSLPFREGLGVGSSALPSDGVRVAVQRATACGLTIQQKLHNYPVAENVRMSMRVAIGAGNAFTMSVGGLYQRWELLVAGDPIKQIGEADSRAAVGDVVLSPQAWKHLQGYGLATDIAAGFMRARAVDTLPPLDPAPEPALTSMAVDSLHAFVPAAVRSRLQAGQSEWLADLRRVSVVLIKLVDLGLESLYGLAPDEVNLPEALRVAERTQSIIRDLQKALYRHEGSINKLTCDDNGVTLLAALGLPPLAHEDNAARAVRAAAAMQRVLHASGMRGSIGVATGLVFCGELGNKVRREYTMNGDTMAMAARLMQSIDDGILCDHATYAAARQRITFHALDPIPMKNMPDPVPVYRPSIESTASSAVGALVGRTAERARLYARLGKLEDGQGGLVMIAGEPGIGKSRLVADIISVVDETAITAVHGGGDPLEKTTPYHAWRPILMTLLGLDPMSTAAQRSIDVVRALESDLRLPADQLALAPLLSPILSLDIADNAITAEMAGQMRADGVNGLLVKILRVYSERAPLLIALEDGHWIDASSWALARLAHQQVDRMLCVVTTRPVDDPPDESRWLYEAEDKEFIALEDLPDDDLRSLLCYRLGVDTVPEPVEHLIRAKTHGNPFFAEELALTLRDRGAILVADHECRLKPGIDLASVDLPDSVQGVITSRIDRLTPPQQLALKSASVIGRLFPYRILRDVYPIEDEKDTLPDSLETLARLGLTPLDENEPELSYLFKHAITQDVVYQQMLFAQRRQLHRAVAQWYEATETDLVPLYPLLAHHWSQARTWSKAVDYLDKAAEAALRNGAYQEAVSFLRDAVDIAGRELTSTPSVRRARWQRQLGDALLALGRTNESRTHLERAASMLGRPAPRGNAQLYTRLLAEAARQAVGYFFPVVGRTRTDEQRALQNEAARTYERLAEIHYLVNEPELLVHAFLVSGNLARISGLAPELARAYANIGLAAGLIPLHGVAEAYRRRAVDAARSAGQLAAHAWVLEVTSVYDAGIGKWEQATRNLGEAMEMYDRIQDRAHWGECQAMTAEVNYHQGRFARCAEIYGDMYARAVKTGNAIEKSWGAIGQAQGLLPLGRYEEAIEFSEATARIMAETANPDIPVAIDIRGFLAVAHLRLGRPEQARDSALDGLEIIRKVSPSAVAAFEGYAGIAETLLSLWETGHPLGSPKEAAKGASAFHRYAAVFPIAVARDCYYRGRIDWNSGRRRRALALWRRGVDAAVRLKMPYDEALNRRMLGLHLPPTEAVSETARAAELLSALGIGHIDAFAIPIVK